MSQIIQSGTAKFNSPYSRFSQVTVTFPSPFPDIVNLEIVATPKKVIGLYTAIDLIDIIYDPSTLTTTGVTFTVVQDKGYVGELNFDWIATYGTDEVALIGKNWYVDQVNGNDVNSGTSWANAFQSLGQAQTIAPSGTIFIASGYVEPLTFTVTKGFSFFSMGFVRFANGVIINSPGNTSWMGEFGFNSTNTPALSFIGARLHFFDQLLYNSTYNSSFTGTLASAVTVSNQAQIVIRTLYPSTLTVSSNTTVTRCAHFYSNVSGFQLSIGQGDVTLNRSLNGITYNFYYSNVTSAGTTAYFNNITVFDQCAQTDSTISDVFMTDTGCAHPIFVNNLKVLCSGAYASTPKLRLANCNNNSTINTGIYINSYNVNVSAMPVASLVLSNSTSATDKCLLTNGVVSVSATLTTLGAGHNVYSYVDGGGVSHASSVPVTP